MTNKLLETLADIAYHAGQQGYYTGDSRADVNTFIYWAHEFEQQHADTTLPPSLPKHSTGSLE